MLTAQFSERTAKVRDGGRTVDAPVEWVEIGGFDSRDVVSRRARPADRVRFKTAYAAFKPPEKAPEKPAPKALKKG